MLRVIAGKYGSRNLTEAVSDTTRPTTDKNKESMFNTLGQFFEKGHVLDLFAGSGSLGIEALSRGMDKATFIERDFGAYKVINANLSSLGITKDKDVKLLMKDAFIYLRFTTDKYDLIIVDPPYSLNPYAELLDTIATRQLLNENGIIVMESDSSNELPKKSGNLVAFKDKVLGNSKFTYYKMEE